MRRSLRIDLVTLVAVPVAVGVVLGANQTRAGAYLPWLLSIGYWVAISLVTWLLIAAATWVVARVLKPWSPPDWVAWIGGAVVGSLAARPAIYAVANLFSPLMEGAALRQMPPAAFTADFLRYYVTNWSVIIAMWVAVCWVRKLWAGARPVQGEIPATEPVAIGPAEAPYAGFLERLPAGLGSKIVALRSEDHYVRVYTPLGDTLVLATLSEAVRTCESLGLTGVRVHRCWWIAAGAVTEIVRNGRKLAVRLENAVEVPVSQTYREVARHAGILRAAGSA